MDGHMSDEDRIKELNDKATQLLTFLSFALIAAILLETAPSNVLTSCQKIAAKWSMRFWVLSLFPILAIVLPVKEWNTGDTTWFKHLRTAKVVLLTIAVLLIIPGAIAFLCAIW